MTLLKRILHFLFGILVIALGLVLTLLNPGLVTLNVGIKTLVLPLPTLVLVVFIFGLVLGLCLGFSQALVRFWRNNRTVNLEALRRR